VHERCAISATERDLRRTRRRFGNGWLDDSPEPWTIATGATSEGPVTIAGIAWSGVRRLTIAGPGGTFLVPRSRTGAFEIVRGRSASGRAVITAQLTDGTTRSSARRVPPNFRPPGVAVARDPAGLPAWCTPSRSSERADAGSFTL
jgi:hypothetical protein